MTPQQETRSPFADQIASLSPGVLSPIAATALGVSAASVTGFEVEAISRGSTAAGTFRVAGQAQVGGHAMPWSTVLKLLRREAPEYDGFFRPVDDPSSVTYWRREYEVYRSGMLDDMPIPFRTVRCYQTDERDGALWCWLEDLGNIDAERWTDDQFALVARQLGMFNALWLTDRALPDAPWLCKNLVRWRLEARQPTEQDLRHNVAALNELFHLEDVWTHDAIEASWRLLEDCPAFLDALEQLPKTFMHQDAGRKSLIQRWTADQSVETVAIDWDFCGIGEVGGEIATLVSSSSRWFGLESERLAQVEQRVVGNYVRGLRSMGWHGDEDQVRLAYLITSAIMFRPGIMQVDDSSIDRYAAMAQAQFGQDLAHALRRWGTVNLFILEKAQQARDILGMGRTLEVGRD